ncbi:MAG: translation initiation factor IF-3 [Candidatus Dojkabacteria bacterium]|nr:MAG: translation initiation factor IF-3 [Candidatus Dojkabacteria bacterium]
MYKKSSFNYKRKSGGYRRDSYQDRSRDFGPRRNHMIRVPEVMLIDENNENVGVVAVQIAQTKARDAGLDLVEVAPNAKPPVCRIMDYSKFLYEQKKKQREGKQKTKNKPLKQFKFSPVIDQNDIEYKSKRAKEYLSKGHQVRLTMERRGRQTHEQAKETFLEILTKFEGYSTIEPVPKTEGKKIFITYKPDGKNPKTKQNEEDSTQEAKEE